MRDCKRVWIEVLILFLCLVVTANPLRAEAQQGGATPSHREGAGDVKVWVRLICGGLYDFLIQKVELDSKPAFQTEVGEIRRVIQGRVSGSLFIGPERVVYHADQRHPAYSFDESRTAVQWEFPDYCCLTLHTPRRKMAITGAQVFQKDNPPNTAVVNDRACTLLHLASSDFAAAETQFQEITNRLPAVRKARWRDLQPTIAAWRTLATKAPLNPEADREWVLAENAFKEKNFASAAEHYEAALDIQPMWPTGWFNLAMIYSELGQFAEAADAMQHYLELVPDASDAKSAREQMIIWEDKAKH